MPHLRLAAVLALAALGAAPARQETLKLQKGDRISIIGNTLADRQQHDGWLETMLQARFPQPSEDDLRAAGHVRLAGGVGADAGDAQELLQLLEELRTAGIDVLANGGHVGLRLGVGVHDFKAAAVCKQPGSDG